LKTWEESGGIGLGDFVYQLSGLATQEMAPLESIRHNNLGAEELTVLCDHPACTGRSDGSVTLAHFHHGYGKEASPLTPEEEDVALSVAFLHAETHNLRMIFGHAADVLKVGGVSPVFFEDVAKRRKAWEAQPHAPYPLESNGVIYVHIAKSERPTARKGEHPVTKEEFNVEKRIFSLLRDQFPGDVVALTKDGRRKENHKFHMVFVHPEGNVLKKKVAFAIRLAYSESGIQSVRPGKHKILEMRAHEWRGSRVLLINGAMEQENILADMIGQMANLQGKWADMESLQRYVAQFPEYPQQCFWSALQKGFFERRMLFYAWVTGQDEPSAVMRPVQAELPGVQTTPEEGAILPPKALGAKFRTAR
jgi:hypothetical protein